jgi:hypothetical protein
VSLVRQIQEAAAGADVPVAVLLRQLKLLSSRLKLPDVVRWADQELAGYESGENLPPYRGPFRARVLGDFGGAFGSGFKNAPIPPVAFPEAMREGQLFNLFFFQGVAELEALLDTGEDVLQEPWPADALAYLQILQQRGETKLNPDLVCYAAWKVVTRSEIVGVIDAIRNRILDFTLQLEEAEPSTATSDEPAIDQGRASQIFHTVIYGGAGNVAVGSTKVTQQTGLPVPGDRDALLRFLGELGLEEDDLTDLSAAMSEDQDSASGALTEPGPRVQSWLGRIMTKGKLAAGRVGTGAAAGLIVEAINHHYHL